MTTPDLTTLRAALAPLLAQQLWQQLQAAGAGGLDATQLCAVCAGSQTDIESTLLAMLQAGLLQQAGAAYAANPAAAALLAATVAPPVRAGLLIGRKNIEAVVSRDRKRRS